MIYEHTTYVKIVVIFYLGFNVEHVSFTSDGGRSLIGLKNLPYYSVSVKTQYVYPTSCFLWGKRL